MARYTINYLTGDTDEITATTVEPLGDQYTAFRGNTPVAHIPAANVRSIIRQDEQVAD
ncbi:hypothetical protein [Streptomyces sp. NPDC008150]|uniref:hypothetical protein n=1 Tax=Streptomyces sp. NPDC008150 TaxID=3364816 RepID=UPI0036E9C67C